MFFNTSVDEILSSFNKTVEKLQHLKEHKLAIADNKTIEAREAQAEADAAKIEAARADVVAKKIQQLIA